MIIHRKEAISITVVSLAFLLLGAGCASSVTTTPRAETTNGTAASTTLTSTALDLSNQGLTQVSQDVFRRTDLTALDLSHNRLTGSIPGEIRFLQALETLDLSDNAMTGLPAEIGQLRHLNVLDVSNNRLTGLPWELGNLSSLTILDLRGNAYSVSDLNAIRASLSTQVKIVVD